MPALFARCDSPLGELVMYSRDGASLYSLHLPGEAPRWASLSDGEAELRLIACSELPLFAVLQRWLHWFWEGCRGARAEMPALEWRGGEFSQAVWRETMLIPWGETSTYGEIAQRAAARLSKARGCARAAGQALKRNPWPLLIPCHRVVGRGGKLTGFSAGDGLSSKSFLLEYERHRLK